MKNIFLISGWVIFTQISFSQSMVSAKSIKSAQEQSDKVLGFKLMEIQAGSIYETLGLKKGDIIKSCNGKPANSVQDSMEMYNQLKTSKKINLEIIRDGKVQKIHYDIK